MNWIKENFLEIALTVNYLITFCLVRIFELSNKRNSELLEILNKMSDRT
jgi:hypothetical protein